MTLFTRIVLVILLLTNIVTAPVYAIEVPYGKMHSDIFENTTTPRFLDDLILENPLYLFSNPFRDQSILTSQKIQEIHTRLPQTKVILHLLCCTLFDNKEVDSVPPGKIRADFQNTQEQFDNFWENHRDSFMKNESDEYVYFKIEKSGNYWIYEKDGYLMNPQNPAYQNFLYNRIKYYITTGGFDGVYLDLMYPRFMQKFYYSRPAVNGKSLTNETWSLQLIALYHALTNKQANDTDLKMKNALILTNSVGNGQDNTLPFNRDLQTHGVQIENPFQDYLSMNHEKWLMTVKSIRDITSLQNNQLAGWINYHTSEFTYPDVDTCDRHGLFTYSSYLLANQSPKFAFFFQCSMGPGDNREPSQNLTHIRLGTPITQYKALSSGLYLREYERGFVLVNPTDSQQVWQTNRALKSAYIPARFPTNTPIVIHGRTGLILLIDDNSSKKPADLVDTGNTPGDQVNQDDADQLKADFGKTGTPGWIRSDINSDGKVDIFDYNILVGAFGE